MPPPGRSADPLAVPTSKIVPAPAPLRVRKTAIRLPQGKNSKTLLTTSVRDARAKVELEEELRRVATCSGGAEKSNGISVP